MELNVKDSCWKETEKEIDLKKEKKGGQERRRGRNWEGSEGAGEEGEKRTKEREESREEREG